MFGIIYIHTSIGPVKNEVIYIEINISALDISAQILCTLLRVIMLLSQPCADDQSDLWAGISVVSIFFSS